MDFENLFETIHFEFVLEGMGMIFGCYLLWKLFFLQELPLLLTTFITTIS